MNIKDRLIVYSADIKGIEDRFIGDYDLYTECLAEFVQDPDFTALADAVRANDVAKAFDAAHSLKGVSGNLGLTPLYKIICKIVEPLRIGNNKNLEPKLVELETEHAKIKELLL